MVFDLTIGQAYSWSNVFGIRAIAALMAVAEVLCFGQKSRMDSVLRLSQDNGRGVEFFAQTDFEEVYRNHAAAQGQRERVSNERESFHEADGDAVVMRLWMEN